MKVKYDKILGRLREGEDAGGGTSTAWNNEIKILCLGNSFTIDELSYVPYITKSVSPFVNLTLAFAYIPGSPIAQHTAYLTGETFTYDGITYFTENGLYYRQPDGQAAETVGYAYYKSANGAPWASLGQKSSIDLILNDEAWDIIIFQADVLNGENSWDIYYAPYIFKIEDAIFGKLGHGVKLGWIPTHSCIHPDEYVNSSAPSDAAKLLEDRWLGKAKNTLEVMRQTAFSVLFPSATAVQNLRCLQDLQVVGRVGFLAWDTPGHLQEGIGPLVSAYANTIAILNVMGLEYDSVFGEQTRPDGEWIEEKQIPSAHGYVNQGGTITWYIAGEGEHYNEYCMLAQIAAVSAVKYPYQLVNPSVSSPYTDRNTGIGIEEYIKNPPTAGTENQILAIDANGDPVWVTPAAGSTVDKEMSNNSTNPVENRVIKAYIDAADEVINTVVSEALNSHEAALQALTGILNGKIRIPVISIERIDQTGESYYNGMPRLLIGAGAPDVSVRPDNFPDTMAWTGVPMFPSQEYYDKTNAKFYKAKPTLSSAVSDWIALN